MSLKINKPVFGILLISFIGLLVVVLSFFVLPLHFYNDTNVIIYDKHNEIGLIGSYPFTILFYNLTGMKHLHFIAIGIIQFLIAIFLMYRIGVPKDFYKITIKNLLVYFAILMIGVFLSMPSKEFINFIFIYFIVRLFQKRTRKLTKTLVIVMVSLAIFAFIYRPYYIVITIISLVLFIASRITIKNKHVVSVIYGLSILILMSLSYGMVKGKYISQKTREAHNEIRVNSTEASNSAIISPVPTDTWYGESFGIVYGFFSANLPVNEFKHIFSPQIIIFIIWQLILFIILFIRYGRCLKLSTNKNRELWAFYVLFAFFIVQGVFEPDLGSAFRHKIGVFPLIYYVLYYDSFREKI